MSYVQMPTSQGRPPTPASMSYVPRPARLPCPYCGTPQAPHTLCTQCGASVPAAADPATMPKPWVPPPTTTTPQDLPKPKPPIMPTPHVTTVLK